MMIFKIIFLFAIGSQQHLQRVLPFSILLNLSSQLLLRILYYKFTIPKPTIRATPVKAPTVEIRGIIKGDRLATQLLVFSSST